jgi:hypothetical protein
MHVEIPHTFSQAQGMERIKKGLVAAKPQMQGQVTIDKEEWTKNTLNFAFTAQKQKITGTVEVLDKKFVVDAKLPLLWRMFEGRIEKAIQEQAASLVR